MQLSGAGLAGQSTCLLWIPACCPELRLRAAWLPLPRTRRPARQQLDAPAALCWALVPGPARLACAASCCCSCACSAAGCQRSAGCAGWGLGHALAALGCPGGCRWPLASCPDVARERMLLGAGSGRCAVGRARGAASRLQTLPALLALQTAGPHSRWPPARACCSAWLRCWAARTPLLQPERGALGGCCTPCSCVQPCPCSWRWHMALQGRSGPPGWAHGASLVAGWAARGDQKSSQAEPGW